MKRSNHQLSMLATLIAAVALWSCGHALAQSYTFGTETQSTNTAGITYDSATGVFEYADAANATADRASIPLTGTAAALINFSNAWHVSVVVNLSAKSSQATTSLAPADGVGLSVLRLKGDIEYYVSMLAGQVNNTGSADPDSYPAFYGTGAHFLARVGTYTLATNQVTTPLGNSRVEDGDSLLPLSGGTNAAPAAETLGPVTNVISLSYDPTTKTVTGYCDSTAVGSYSIASWGATSVLTLYVFGASGDTLDVPTGSDSAYHFSVGTGLFMVPQLTKTMAGTNLLLTWPTNAAGFVLQSSTNLASSSAWRPVAASPAIVNGRYAVTNSTTGTPAFFRLAFP
jgi:hypothetical protein